MVKHLEEELKQLKIENEKLRQEKNNSKERIDQLINEFNDKIAKESKDIQVEFELQIKNLTNQVWVI